MGDFDGFAFDFNAFFVEFNSDREPTVLDYLIRKPFRAMIQ